MTWVGGRLTRRSCVAGRKGLPWWVVRAAKEALSSTPRFTVAVGEEEPIDIEITRGEFEDLIRDDLARTVGVLDMTIRDAGLTRERIAAVYLTGGSSRIPLVADLLAQYHPHTYTRPDPKTLVAQGATRRRAGRPSVTAIQLLEELFPGGRADSSRPALSESQARGLLRALIEPAHGPSDLD